MHYSVAALHFFDIHKFKTLKYQTFTLEHVSLGKIREQQQKPEFRLLSVRFKIPD